MNSHLLRSGSLNSSRADTSSESTSKDTHKYGCLLLPLPDMACSLLREWQEDFLRPEHLAPSGREDEPHITLKYGFEGNHQAILEALVPLFIRHGPIRVRFTRLSVFPDSGDGAVLKLGVQSRELHELYHWLSQAFPCKDKHYPHYQPHATIAYLDPAFGESYLLHRTPLDGQELLLDQVVYSTPEGTKTPIPLSGIKTLSWINPLCGGALVEPPETGISNRYSDGGTSKIKRNKPVFNSLISRKSFQSNRKVVPTQLTKN